MLKLENWTKSFNDNVVLNDINVDVDTGDVLTIIGSSGSGKSTLLRTVNFLEPADSGLIQIGSTTKNVENIKEKEILDIRRQTAMVFQNYALYPHMTVYENMAFGLKLRKDSKSQIKEKVHEAASILGIEELLDRKPRALSGGQRQRVALGRAIVRKPNVFLMDEPLSNLDAKLRVQT